MKHTPITLSNGPLLAFGAHPDDVEFGCGGVVLAETRSGRRARVVVCSRGEAGTHGTPAERTQEAERGAAILGASIEFLELGGDARLEIRTAHALKIAGVLRREKPAVVLAPLPEPNQHPDHARLGQLVRDAARLARYGNVPELNEHPPHAIEALFFYEVTSAASAPPAVLVDVSDLVPEWTAAMEAHASQLRTRNYIELQLTKARLHGLRAGVSHAIALHAGDPLVVSHLGQLGRGARTF
ncbi:MAG: PIG-L family deacetylase [Phycisphaerae bacterium]